MPRGFGYATGELGDLSTDFGNLNIANTRPPGDPLDLANLLREGFDPRFKKYLFEGTETQKHIPFPLRTMQTNEGLNVGVQNILDLIRRPGGLAPNVSEAILPRLSMESQSIAQNFRNLQSNQAGAAARGNLPVSIKAALQSALDVSQERAQRGARSEALSQSEQLRRQDLDETYKILDAILGFVQSGRGQDIANTQAGQAREAQSSQKESAAIAALGAILAAFASGSRFKEGIVPVETDRVLDAIAALPVYHWRYKGDSTQHLGPLAEDFQAAFGVGDSPDKIYIVDAIGSLMAATQALAHKVERMEAVRG